MNLGKNHYSISITFKFVTNRNHLNFHNTVLIDLTVFILITTSLIKEHVYLFDKFIFYIVSQVYFNVIDFPYTLKCFVLCL